MPEGLRSKCLHRQIKVGASILGVDTFPILKLHLIPKEELLYEKNCIPYYGLIEEIGKNDLRYFQATMATMSHNPNMFPTFFIDPAKEYIYMYYTNTRCIDQNIR